MRLAALALALMPSVAVADVSALIAERGLTGARAELENLPDPTPDDRFALGGVIFLQTIEAAYQTRWRTGLTTGDVPVPVLRADLPPNPAPEQFDGATVRGIFEGVVAGMDAAHTALAAVPDDASPTVTLALPDLWFDIDGDGERSEAEGFGEVALQTLLTPPQRARIMSGGTDPLAATIRFDTADLHWLRAYTRLLAGIGRVVLALDPAPAVDDLLAFRASPAISGPVQRSILSAAQRSALEEAIRTQNPGIGDAEVAERLAQLEAQIAGTSSQMPDGRARFGAWADIAAVIVSTLERSPDPVLLSAARDDFLGMVAHNRDFWQALALETDDENEWIPNPAQTAALGFDLPDGIDGAWLAILDDAERALRGDLLIPHWRFSPGWGVDLDAYVADPAPLDPVGWIQGAAAVPYAREGDVMTQANWFAFRRLVRGQTGLFVILLN